MNFSWMRTTLNSPAVLFFIFFIPLILVGIWFKDGYILGAAEAEIPFYHLQRPADRTAWAWTDEQLGYVTSFTVASNPSWNFLAWIQNLGIEGFIIQAGVFWLLLVIAGLGVYLFSKELFPTVHPIANMAAVIFYWFNPISLANVWNRFLYNFMCFFALLPIASFLYLRGLLRRNYLYIFWTNLVILLLSFSLTSYVFNLLIWISFLYSTIFYSVVSKNLKTLVFSLKFFSLTLIIFILFNCWWLLPTFNLFTSPDTRSALTADVYTTEGNLITLDLLSRKLGNLTFLSRLMHQGFYNEEGPLWSQLYNNWFISLMLFVFTIAIFWVIYKYKKDKGVLYLSTFFIMLLFLAKGSNPPFGQVFKFVFKKIIFFQVFRNPYEKFGFLLAFVSAPLFGYAINKLGSLHSRFKTGIIFFTLILAGAIFGYPFFKDLVFTGPNFPNNNYSIGYKVEVPNYYQEADNWLLSQGSNFRFIGFPLGGEGITYNWSKGYQGVEVSNTLFSTSNILFNTGGWPNYYKFVGRLEELLFKEKNFVKIANVINAKYLMVRKDINFNERLMKDPKSVQQRMEQIEGEGSWEKDTQFGNLFFWRNLRWSDKTIYAANNLIEAYPNVYVDDILLQEVNEQSVIYQGIPALETNNLTTSLIVHPAEIFSFNLTSKALIYQFDIKEEGNYSLILTDSSWFDNQQSISDSGIKLLIEGNEVSHSAVLREDGNVMFGNLYLKPGLQKLIFVLPTLTNLMNTPPGLTLNALKKEFTMPLNNYDPYGDYYESIDFLIKQGKGFNIGFEQDNIDTKKSIFQRSVPFDPNYPGVGQVSGFFPRSSTPEKARLFLRIDSDSSEVEFSNLILTKAPKFTPILVKSQKADAAAILPSTSYKKNNPSRYTVQISNASKNFILVLSQLYNPGWQAKYQDGEIIKKHLQINAFANGWIIEREGNQIITLEFAPQKLLDLGKIVSSLSILVSLIYIVSIIFWQKARLWK